MNKENLVEKLSGKCPFIYTVYDDDDKFIDYYYIGDSVFCECNDQCIIDLYEELSKYVYKNNIENTEDEKEIRDNTKRIIRDCKRCRKSNGHIEVKTKLSEFVYSLNEKQLESLYNQMLSFEKLYHDYIYQYE